MYYEYKYSSALHTKNKNKIKVCVCRAIYLYLYTYAATVVVVVEYIIGPEKKKSNIHDDGESSTPKKNTHHIYNMYSVVD